MAHHQHYRSPFGDTTLTKVFVGGLAWETPTDVMRNYFQQFGEILEAVIITDKNTAKSKGYGFVTFRDPESARRACADPNPMIDGRRANCNIASLGRPRPSPPRGSRSQVSNVYQGSGGVSSYLPLPPSPAPPVPPPAPLIYPPYGYTNYSPDYGYQQQTTYNPTHVQQTPYYNQLYASSSSSGLASPYYYGYAPRGTFPMATAQRMPGPSYLYYPAQGETYPHPLPSLQQPTTMTHSSPEIAADSFAPPQTSTETEAGPATPTSSTA